MHEAARRCIACFHPATAAGAALVMILSLRPAAAGGLNVNVIGVNGKPVNDVVATAAPMRATAVARSRERMTAMMDQQHKAFVPQVLVIGRGTWVEFPNNDSVSHQVYSFSPAKKFQLSLYKGELHSPQQFDQAGLVVLGCNIHDQMVGYIYVADTPYFGKTDASGSLRLKDLPQGRYRINIWSPRVADDAPVLSQEVDVDVAGFATVGFKLRQGLRSSPQPRPHPGAWDAY